jgi:pimeloyl-ACP methyl ester carboxylesterase
MEERPDPERGARRERPLKRPQAVLLVHGACTGPWIFEGWASWFPGAAVSAIDLQAGLQLARASMELYTGAIIAEAGRLPWPLLLCGHGMGGLVALMAAPTLRPELLVLIAPFPPADVGGSHPEITVSPGVYEPEEPERSDVRVRLRSDSALARAERLRGISVPPPLRCRSVVVLGDSSKAAPGVARLYGSEVLSFSGLDHLGLVLAPQVPRAIAEYAGLVAGRVPDAEGLADGGA